MIRRLLDGECDPHVLKEKQKQVTITCCRQTKLTFASFDAFTAFQSFFLFRDRFFLSTFEFEELIMPCLLLLRDLFELQPLLPFGFEPRRRSFRLVRSPPAESIAILARVDVRQVGVERVEPLE